MSYWRFAAMIATSTAVMFVLMYLNTYTLEHIQWSQTRFWMAFVMGACMAIIMLSFMLGMYKNKRTNIAIFAGSAAVFVLALWLVRSQATVSGVSYMKAMIPHHSIAIMTSERAQITDPRVRKLADEIIEAQRREISEMKYLVRADPAPADGPEAMADKPQPELVSLAEALATPNIAQLDLGSMDAAEIDRGLGPEPRCEFSYTANGPSVFAGAPGNPAGRGLIKIHGKLVELSSDDAASSTGLIGAATFAADGLRLTVSPDIDVEPLPEGLEGRWPADLQFELVEYDLLVGYRGWYRCSSGQAGRSDI